MKDKNPPTIKNGANGMNFCLFLRPQIIPKMHENTNAIAKPDVPNHNPPVANNLISPMPIGEFNLSWPNFSKTRPTIVANVYPITAPITDSAVEQIHGKKCITINPIKNNGHRYASGIILRRKSATDMRHAQNAAANNNRTKKV